MFAEERPGQLVSQPLQVAASWGSSAGLPMPSAVSAEPSDWVIVEPSSYVAADAMPTQK